MGRDETSVSVRTEGATTFLGTAAFFGADGTLAEGSFEVYEER